MSLKTAASFIAQLLITIFVASVLFFLTVRVLPGDVAILVAGDHATPEDLARIRSELGLDKPLVRQYADFMGGLLRGQLGRSVINGVPVWDLVTHGLSSTIELVVFAGVISVVGGITLGVAGAVFEGRLPAVLARTVTSMGIALPHFYIGITLLVVFGVYLEWLPVMGRSETGQLGDRLRYLLLPGLTLSLAAIASVGRSTQTSVRSILRQPYIRTAWSKGLPDHVVIWKHVLRNALVPVIAVTGLEITVWLAGTIVVETIFSRPGLGQVLIGAIRDRDFPVIQGALIIYIILIVLVNLGVDALYRLADPQLRVKTR